MGEVFADRFYAAAKTLQVARVNPEGLSRARIDWAAKVLGLQVDRLAAETWNAFEEIKVLKGYIATLEQKAGE